MHRREVRDLGIRPLVARRNTGQGGGLGKNHWVVEAAFPLLHWFRRLRIRWEIRTDVPRTFPHPQLRHHLLATPPAVLPGRYSLSLRVDGQM
ncbi:hypothetical protein GTY65_11440 [Streptomyces sp. SID8379]|uniref:hypothetical protein n=1 Tax=unclassified Streptomyces TaxID=2593676 RepID=UPI001319EB00|nr:MULTISPECIES: hypothetical protein [unclassified Streptomyces]MYW64676.1 hypothetical protein [Streptomyces sp. SID8379]